jgi:hypothetical protein
MSCRKQKNESMAMKIKWLKLHGHFPLLIHLGVLPMVPEVRVNHKAAETDTLEKSLCSTHWAKILPSYFKWNRIQKRQNWSYLNSIPWWGEGMYT